MSSWSATGPDIDQSASERQPTLPARREISCASHIARPSVSPIRPGGASKEAAVSLTTASERLAFGSSEDWAPLANIFEDRSCAEAQADAVRAFVHTTRQDRDP